jgi:hypothetical protein
VYGTNVVSIIVRCVHLNHGPHTTHTLTTTTTTTIKLYSATLVPLAVVLSVMLYRMSRVLYGGRFFHGDAMRLVRY